MIIRIFSAYGRKRIDIDDRESVATLYDKVRKEYLVRDFRLTRKPNGEEPIQTSSKHLGLIGIKHSDILYMHTILTKITNDMEIDGDMGSSNTLQDSSQTNKFLQQEDEIDKILSKMDGKIYRQRNDQYCRHGPLAKCIHCVPLEPYDGQYLEHCDPPIQFMSFHAYLRKLSGGQHQGKFTTLENINCKIRGGCREHAPWPEGICTKCQPNAITLSVQKYRHVDNIMFENASLMNNFLDFWRRTGNQRIGILFGYYTTFDQAPLGIKAVVSAIYEPAQKSTTKSVELLNLKRDNGKSDKEVFLSSSIMEVAETLGLSPVGWIFTDLVSDDAKAGTVRHYRGTIDTYFLTAQECITAAFLQNLFPNICNLSAEGQFGSKFVTVVVTGDASNNIHFEGYQVSNQCMALVRDDILVPTHDAPELGFVRQSTCSQYVPDVFFTQKDKYGNSVTTAARPLPVEFLLVHMTAAFPIEEHFSLTQRNGKFLRFPIENRQNMSEKQDLESLMAYLSQFTTAPKAELSAGLANVHLLWYLNSCPAMVGLRPHVKNVCMSLRQGINSNGSGSGNRDRDLARAVEAFKNSAEWTAMVAMVGREGRATANGATGGSEKAEPVWSCQHCTFHNEFAEASCQMCGLPR